MVFEQGSGRLHKPNTSNSKRCVVKSVNDWINGVIDEIRSDEKPVGGEVEPVVTHEGGVATGTGQLDQLEHQVREVTQDEAHCHQKHHVGHLGHLLTLRLHAFHGGRSRGVGDFPCVALQGVPVAGDLILPFVKSARVWTRFIRSWFVMSFQIVLRFCLILERFGYDVNVFFKGNIM